MKINIPELKLLGENANSANALNVLVCLLEYKVQYLSYNHIENNSDDVEGSALQIVSKVLKSLRTLTSICERDYDYIAANTLLRMLVDSVAVYKLIYGTNDVQEREYRHYLYMLDGLSVRDKLMKDEIEYDGKITKEEYEKLKRQYEETHTADMTVIEHCKNKLKSHPYASLYGAFHAQSVENSNWKYKDKVYKNKVRENQYTWRELYEQLDSRKKIVSYFSSFLSQFVHGLTISNIRVRDDDNDNLNIVMSFAVVLAGILFKEMNIMYPNNDEIYADFFESQLCEELLENYDLNIIQSWFNVSE